jgi:hypothetical protein
VCSQPRKNLIGIGGEVSYPVYAYESNEAVGLGINIKGEHFFGSKFSGLVTVGYTSYRGKLVYWDGTEDKDFALVPVLIGARIFLQRFYAEFEFGVAVKASENVNTTMTVAPAIGFMNKKLDLAIRFFAVPAMPSIPENTFLEKGGYSYLTLRFFYNLN